MAEDFWATVQACFESSAIGSWGRPFFNSFVKTNALKPIESEKDLREVKTAVLSESLRLRTPTHFMNIAVAMVECLFGRKKDLPDYYEDDIWACEAWVDHMVATRKKEFETGRPPS